MNITYRRDGRTKSQFKKDIKNRTAKEKFLVDIFQEECRFGGHAISVRDYGVDNTGKILETVTCAPDFEIAIDGSTSLYDVKCSPVSTRCTFKTNSLKRYVEYKASILLFYGVGRIDGNLSKFDKINARWAIITTSKIKKLLELPSYT